VHAGAVAADDVGVDGVAVNGATTGPISATTPDGTATNCCFSIPPPPTITGFSPTSSRPGRPVTITGTNFTDATAITLGTTPATFTLGSSTVITAVVPTITRGYYNWSVTTTSGTATSTGAFRDR
jgi:IPT/TIG domain